MGFLKTLAGKKAVSDGRKHLDNISKMSISDQLRDWEFAVAYRYIYKNSYQEFGTSPERLIHKRLGDYERNLAAKTGWRLNHPKKKPIATYLAFRIAGMFFNALSAIYESPDRQDVLSRYINECNTAFDRVSESLIKLAAEVGMDGFSDATDFDEISLGAIYLHAFAVSQLKSVLGHTHLPRESIRFGLAMEISRLNQSS